MDWRQHFHTGTRQVIGVFLIVFALAGAWLYRQENQLLQASQPNVASIAQVTTVPATPVTHATFSATPESQIATPLLKGQISLSVATQAELETLPGIGPTKAKAIIEYRASKGFKTVNDLEKVKGIGPKTLEKLRPLIVL